MFIKGEKGIKLSDSLEQFINQWKDKPGNLIPILHKVQEEYGYIPLEVAVEISRRLHVPLAKIYGVATFYHFFKLKKPGKFIINVCLGTACYLKGGADLLEELKNILGIDVGEVTEDGIFSIEPVRCLGCCGLAPVIMINGKVYGRLTKDDLPKIISEYKALAVKEFSEEIERRLGDEEGGV